jgi:hypothetical protein
LCNLVEADRRFTCAYCIHNEGEKKSARGKAGEKIGTGRTRLKLIALIVEAVSTSETSVYFYYTTQGNIPNTVLFILVTMRI